MSKAVSVRIREQHRLLKKTSDPVLAQMANTTLNRIHDGPEFLFVSTHRSTFEAQTAFEEDLQVAGRARHLVSALLRSVLA